MFNQYGNTTSTCNVINAKVHLIYYHYGGVLKLPPVTGILFFNLPFLIQA